MLIEELEKQYDVEQVNLSEPLTPDKYDTLLVVQPSSLDPQQLGNLVAAVGQGQPTAIFEDPAPNFFCRCARH